MPEEAVRTCGRCQAGIPAGANFCPVCAAPIRPAEGKSDSPPAAAGLVCRQCGHSLPAGVAVCPACVTPPSDMPKRAQAAESKRDDTPVLQPGTLVDGKYEILDLLGSGGFSNVYRARHRDLEREFAVKMLHDPTAAQGSARQRFFREAQALLDLFHPRLLTLREVGKWHGHLYMVMDLCRGETVRAILKQRGRLSPWDAAEVAMQVLEVLEYAHSKGVIHRDLKPTNLMNTPAAVHEGPRLAGTGTSASAWNVKVLDFGIAKVVSEGTAESESGGLTRDGVVLGTPEYTSPEQLEGMPTEPRADLYSLGVVMYEMITGRRPFQGENWMNLCKKVLMDAPPRFATVGINEGIPGLEELVLQSLAKRPEGRPASAGEMLHRLKVLVAGAPTAVARRGVEGTPVPGAAASSPASDWSRADRLQPVATWKGHTGWIVSVAFGPDGRHALSGSWDKTVKLWEVGTGRELATWTGHERSVISVAFHPDGKRALSGSWDKTLKLWDVEGRRELATWKGHAGQVLSVAFSADGKHALSGSLDATLRRWDVESGRELAVWQGHTGPVRSAVFSPDGTRALSGGDDKTLRLWEPAQGRELARWTGHEGPITAVAFSPDGAQVLSGSMDKGLKLWEAGTGKPIASWPGHTGQITALAFSPDGKRILSASRDRELLLRDAQTGRVVQAVPVVGSFPTSVAIWGDCALVGNYACTLTLYRQEGSVDVPAAFLPDALVR